MSSTSEIFYSVFSLTESGTNLFDFCRDRPTTLTVMSLSMADPGRTSEVLDTYALVTNFSTGPGLLDRSFRGSIFAACH